MQPVILQMIILLHAAFGCMFLFMNWQHPARFARLMAQSWLVEAVRAGILLAQLGQDGTHHWHSLSDCLNLVATWWLLAGCADLMGVKLPARLGWWYLGLGLPVVLALRYPVPAALAAMLDWPAERANRLAVQVELALVFSSVAAARLAILVWLVRFWRETRLLGALLAVVFGVPYIVFALAVPFQFHFDYNPPWIYLTWTGRVLGFSLGLVMLLFDRQQVEQQQRERAYRRIVETSHDLIWSVDAAGRWTSVNQATRGIYGCEPGEMLGRPFTDFVTPERVEADREAFERIKTGTSLFNFETVHRRKDGMPVNLSFNAVVLRDEHGMVLGATGTAQDITERKRAEERARHLANFPELNPNPVLEFTEGGLIAYQNPAAQAMVVRMGQESLDQLLPPDTPAIVAQCLASRQPRLRVVTTHGKTTLSWSFYPIVSQRVVHCYIGDITERMQLEEQLRQAQKMEAVGQLAGGVAHDFNNLLTAIIGHLGLLQTGRTLPPEAAESLKEISHAATRAANLTGQLLAFSRLQVINIRPLDLNEVVTHLAKMLRRLLGEDIAMHLDFAKDRLYFNGDASMIDQVIVNLAVNARDAMPGGGTLHIRTGSETRVARTADGRSGETRPDSFVVLTIRDTGTGIPADVLPKIFEPFFTTKEVGKGTGLGLATAFGIVQQHQGWIEVESERGQGTTFRIYVPRLAAPPVELPGLRPAAADRGRGELILLVEDEAAVREVGVRALTGKGYRVLAAANGHAALEWWNAHKDDIALLYTDLIMPGGLSGLQLARQLLAEKPGLRVIYTSGYSREIAGKELALDDSVNYLAKPYELEDLFRLVRGTLDGRRRTLHPFGTD
jgi:two-component system, cell cycle sensor histidine kinase and response regulator CckA